MKIEVGFSQLVMRSPWALPKGTRPVASPPIAAPSAKGVRTEETAEAASMRPISRGSVVPLRSA